jgi:hypothetical protein
METTPAPTLDAATTASTEVVEWTIKVDVAFESLAGTHYHADLFRQSEWLCRIAMSGAARDRAEAERVLSERCRDWIASYEKRDRTGDTSFQLL